MEALTKLNTQTKAKKTLSRELSHSDSKLNSTDGRRKVSKSSLHFFGGGGGGEKWCSSSQHSLLEACGGGGGGPIAAEAEETSREPQQEGYHCNLVDEKLAASLAVLQIHCNACRGILRDPCQTTCCGKDFCQSCLERLMQKKLPCLHCDATGYDGYNNEDLKKELKKIEVYCTNEARGCGWKGTIKKLKQHLNQYNTDGTKVCQWIQCPACLKHVQQNEWQKHRSESCPMRMHQCQYCGCFTSTFQDFVANHKPVCMYAPAPCPNGCGEAVMQLDLEDHVRNDCLRKVMSCEFKAFGCTAALTRQNMKDHLNDRSTMHSTMLARALKEMVTKELPELRAEMKRLRDENERLRQIARDDPHGLPTTQGSGKKMEKKESPTKQRSDETGSEDLVTCAEFVMGDYAKHKRDNASWFSPPFYTQQKGRRMCLEVLANGDGEGKGQYISVYLYFMCGEFDGDVAWPFRGSLVVELLDQKPTKGGGNAAYRQTIRYAESTRKEYCDRVLDGERSKHAKGLIKFIHLSEIPVRFLKKDSLRFRICRHKLASR